MVGMISHKHFHTPMETDIIIPDRLKSSICDGGICLPFLQLLPMVIPNIKLGTLLNAHCIFYNMLSEEWSLTGILHRIVNATIIPAAITHLLSVEIVLYKTGAARYSTSIIDTNHAPR